MICFAAQAPASKGGGGRVAVLRLRLGVVVVASVAGILDCCDDAVGIAQDFVVPEAQELPAAACKEVISDGVDAGQSVAEG